MPARLNPIRRLFYKPDESLLLSLCQAIDAALHAEPRIQNIRWWTRDFHAGPGNPHPDAGTVD